MKLLIVDDAREIRQLLANILRGAGYEELEFATTGEETLDLIDQKQSAEEGIDLILLDVNLPDIDGIEVCRRLKRRSEMQDVPIIMVTADEDSITLEEAFSAGAIDYIIKPFSRIELKARVGSAIRLRQEIKQRNAREEELEATARKLEKANRKLERMVSIDGLTGLANRRLFDEVIAREWQRARRKDEYLALIMLDIDHFKSYNDAYGHQAGDKCLKKLAGRLGELIVRPGDLAARYGGEEFVVVLPGTDLSGAVTVAERIRMGVMDLKLAHKKSPIAEYVTVSLGVATAQPEQESGSERLIEAADKALYRAKEAGRNRVKAESKTIN